MIRQLLTESTILALAAGLFGWLLGLWGVEALVTLSPENLPRLSEVSLDRQVFAYALAISLAAGGLFGLVPVAGMLRRDLSDALRDGAQRASLSGRRTRGLLVVAEIAVSLVLLVGAGLVLQSLYRLWNLDPGFSTADVLTVDLSLAGSGREARELQSPFFDDLLAEVRSLPHVKEAGLITHLPIGGDIWGTSFQIEGRPASSVTESPHATFRVASPGLFQALGVPLLAGRPFDRRDQESSQPTVIVSRTLAERYWGNLDVIGRRIREGGPESEAPWLTVVGVAGDVRQWDLAADFQPGIYFSYRQNPVSWFLQTTLVVRTAGDPGALRRVVADSVWNLEPDVAIAASKTMPEILRRAVWRQRFNASLLVLFAGLAVALAAVGIYAIMSYAVSLRCPEIGVRIALGAGRRQILKLIVGQGMWLTVGGLAVGLLGAAALARFLTGLLFGIKSDDPATYLAVAVGLATVAFVACYLPARRASRLDPMASLRSE